MDTITNQSREIETERHTRDHIKGILNKSTLTGVTKDTKRVTETRTKIFLRHHFKVDLSSVVHTVKSPR